MEISSLSTYSVNNDFVFVNNQRERNYNIELGKNNTVIEREKTEIEEKPEGEIINAVESANKKFIAYDRKFEFSIHEKTKEIMVKVIDVNTNEVIREIPPEKILDLVAAIWEIAGIIVDEKI